MTTGEPAVQRKAVATHGRGPAGQAGDAESMSLLALRLRADLQPQDGGRSLLVAAASDDEAGLTLTLELAWCLAEELGHSVLLVDGAFGVRSLSQGLGLDGAAGLAECIDTPADADSRLPELTQATRHPRISVLPQGDPSGAVTVREQSIRSLLALACQRHDFVLISSSLRADVGRALAFCGGVDAALLMALEERSTWDDISRGQRLLDECGARRVALVLAQAPAATRKPR